MKPVSLEVKNFFSHRESFIDFDFTSALLIGSTDGDYNKSNGSGKSAIFEALTWSLYNKSRAPTMNDLVRWGEDICSSNFIFEEAGKLYRIERTRNRINSNSTVSFFKKDEIGSWVDISGSTPTLTNKEIELTVGMDYRTFVNSVYFRQNDISEFAEAEPYKKKEMLKSIIDIGRWDEYEKKSKAKAKLLKIDLQVLNSSLFDSEALEISKGQKEYQIGQAKVSSERLKNNLIAIESRYTHCFEQYINLKNSLDTNQYDKIVLQMKNIEDKITSIEKDKESYTADYKKYMKEIRDFASEIKSIDSEIKSIPYKEGLDEEIELIRDLGSKLKAEYDANISKMSELESKSLSSGNCDVCGQEVDQHLYNELCESRSEEVIRIKEENEEALSKIKKAKLDLKDLKSLKVLNSKHNEIRAKKSLLEERIVLYEDQKSIVLDNINSLKRQEKECRSELLGLETSLSAIKDASFATVKSELKKLKSEKEELSEALFSANKSIGIFENELLEINNKLSKNIDTKIKIKNLQEEIVVYDYLTKYLGKSGIQVILINNLIEDLEEFCNKILQFICNEEIKIALETQKLRSDGASIVETLSLKILKDGHKYDYKSLSGGEKFRIGLSLGLGLSDLTSRYGGGSLDFIMLDEVNAPLDRYGVENLMVSVINKLSENIKILTITHDESLKEKFNYIIDVSKVNGESSVNYYSLE